jgi:flagellar hook-basal body complex protein FliE
MIEKSIISYRLETNNLWSGINQEEGSKMEDLKSKSIQPLSLPRVEKGEAGNAAPWSDFKKILSSAIQEVNKLQTQANESVQGMVSGKTDIHTTMIAMENS